MIEEAKRPRLGLGKKVAFALVPLVVLLGASEIVIRWTGVHERCSERQAALVRAVGQCHPILGYTAFPGRMLRGKPFNQAGFRSREFRPKTPGVLRILALGDSCTFGMTAFREGFYAEWPYPQRLEELAEKRLGLGKLEVLNAGMGGYNSFHGVMQLRTVLRDLEPDLVTVRFGWNDHFMSSTVPRMSEPSNPVLLALQDLLLHTATYRFALRVAGDLRIAASPVEKGLPKMWRPTVGLEEFRRNLHRIVDLAKGMGARVWLLTAPDPFSDEKQLQRWEALPRNAEARRILRLNALPSFRALMKVHRKYMRVVREVAAERQVPLVDMAASYEERGTETLFLLDDPVHPRQQGYDLEAEVLYARLVSDGVVGTGD